MVHPFHLDFMNFTSGYIDYLYPDNVGTTVNINNTQ